MVARAGPPKNHLTKVKKNVDVSEAKKELEMVEHKVDLKGSGGLTEVLGVKADVYDQGLDDPFANKRLNEEGENALTPPPQEAEWKKFARELFSFFACLLWLGSILCFIGYALRQDADNLALGVVLAAVVTITAIFSYFQNKKAGDLMNSFKNMMPTMVTVMRGGQKREMNARTLVRGDIVFLKGGDKVPADVRILECTDDCVVDNASLTGEAEPVKKKPTFTDENPLETANLAFFGTFMPQGKAKGIVVNIGDTTVMGRIASLTLQTDAGKTPIAIEIEHFVHIVSAVAIFLGVAFVIVCFILTPTDYVGNLVFMIGIIVANVPEGLLATVTVCLTLTANRMATKSVLVKNLEGVETLGSTTCICSDKTGTLTQNIMTVANIVYDNAIFDAECSLTPVPTYDKANGSYKALQRCATLCNNASFDETSRYKMEQKGKGLEATMFFPTQAATTNDFFIGEAIKINGKDANVVLKGGEMVGQFGEGKYSAPLKGLALKDIQRRIALDFRGVKTMGDGSRMEMVMWNCIGDASESAMIKFCQDKRDVETYRAYNEKLTEIPFNSKNKYQLSVHKDEKRNGAPILVMKGAPERIISRCGSVLINGVEEKMTPERKAEIEKCQLELSKKGMRVLGFCEKELDSAKYPATYKYTPDNPNFPLGDDPKLKETLKEKPDDKRFETLCFVGLMALIDPPRPQVPPAVALCKTAGIKVIMVTGDHPITAKAISHKVGILWGDTKEDVEEYNKENGYSKGDPRWRDPEDQNEAPAVVTPGWELSVDMGEDKWDAILSHSQCVFARTSPQQKLIIVENCQRNGHIVAVTGDGVNDSPALKKADIGVAMGIMGSDVSKEAADMILLDDNFASIVAGVEEGRLIFDNLKKSIAYTLSSNIPEISPFLVFVCLSCPLPLSTVLILCVDLGTDMVPAISMAYEKAESDIMQRPPRNATVDRLVTKKLVSFAYLQIGIIQAAAGFYTWMVVLNDYGYAPQVLPGNGANQMWDRHPLFCQLNNGEYCNQGTGLNRKCEKVTGLANYGQLQNLLNKASKVQSDPYAVCIDTTGATVEYGKCDAVENPNHFAAWPLWRPGEDGYITKCSYAVKEFSGADGWEVYNGTKDNKKLPAKGDYASAYRYTFAEGDGFAQPTAQSVAAILKLGYMPYMPYRARTSPYYNQRFFSWPQSEDGTKGKCSYEGTCSKNGSPVPGTGEINPLLLYGYQPVVGRWSSPAKPATGGSPGDEGRMDAEAVPTQFLANGYKIDETVKTIQCDGLQDNERLLINTTCTKSDYKVTNYKQQDVLTSADIYADPDGGRGGTTHKNAEALFYYPFIAKFKPATAGADDWSVFTNIFSRMSQKEANHHAQGSFWMCIVVVQWADLLICRTRWLSIKSQGMENSTLNFGLFFETMLAAWLAYFTPFHVLGTRNIRVVHWFPAMPFSMFIFAYDEVRKYLMRVTSPVKVDPKTGRTLRSPGWLERNTYY